jgi:sn-glycerol 3-phosphate transport system permease protein
MPTDRRKPRWGVHLGLIVACALMACPAVYALQVATLNIVQSYVTPAQLFPPGTSLGPNVETLFARLDFGRLILNTAVVTLVVVIGKTALALLCGLAFVYFQFPGKWVLFFVVLLTLLLPTEIILIPLFGLVSDLDWVQISPRLVLTIPFLATAAGAFLFRQHFSGIPRELAEAAQIDGATPVRFLFAVLVPMSWNVIGAHALIQFIASWNSYLWPVLVLQDNADQVVQVGVRNALGFGGQTNFGVLMAAGIVASLPPLVLFLVLQRQFMNGFAISRDK